MARIPPPHPDRPPLVVNLFEVLQHGNTQLIPLFPYMHPGAMVPAGALLRGGPGKRYGQFFHHNTVDEVVMCYAASGSVLQTGQVFVGGRVHGVTSFLKDEKNPESFAVMCITQRQAENGPQDEAVELRCGKCNESVFHESFDGTPPAESPEGIYAFPSISVPPKLLAAYNASPERRTCRSCGHVNEPFPLADWGWETYLECSERTSAGLQLLEKAANP
jgi:hypothetical protein